MKGLMSVGCALLMAWVSVAACQGAEDWQNSEMIGQNKEPGRGRNFVHMVEVAEQIDTSRPFHYRQMNAAKGVFTLDNRYDFAALNAFQATWALTEDGTVLQSGTLPCLDTRPKANCQVTIPCAVPLLKAGRDYHSKITFALAQENYWDRSGGYAVGQYEGKVADLAFDYIGPQECANRTDVRWAAWTAPSGSCLLVVADPLLSVSAWPYGMADIDRETVRHPHEIPASDTITVNIDLIQMGVGGRNSWGARTDPQYLLPADHPYEYRFTIRPYSKQMGCLNDVARD